MIQSLPPTKTRHFLFTFSIRVSTCLIASFHFLVRDVILLVLLSGAGLLAQAQTIRYVKPRHSGDGSGSSWANASGNLQVMINASAANDQVWVAAGTYKPTSGNNRTISFTMKEGVSIYGGFTGSETSLSQRPAINLTTRSTTTLSGDIDNSPVDNSGNSYNVISNRSGLTNNAVLDGFVITGGNANGDILDEDGRGGGMYNNGRLSSCAPLIRNCAFVNNLATYGGAIYNDGFLGNSSPTLINCSFQANSAHSGGAIYNNGERSGTSSPTLANCSFEANSAPYGGAMYNYGIYPAASSPTLTNSSFQANSATAYGGAIYNYASGTQVLTNCSFQANSAPEGGAFFNLSTYLVLTNCVLWNNGGNNTFNSGSHLVTATYSLFDNTVTNYSTGTGNKTTSISPFAATTNTGLNGCSQALNAGDNAAYNSALGPATDLMGNPRFFNNGRIDMGAYEYQAVEGIIVTAPGVNTATVGVAFNQAFHISGGTAPYSYSLASGSLPAGLTLTTSGVLSGSPTQAGNFTFTVQVQETNTSCSGVSATYALRVASDMPIRYVRAAATGSGNSWADASGDLQSQINFAGAEQVWVATGTYRPTGTPAVSTNRSLSFSMKNGVLIYGGFTGNETALNQRAPGNMLATILSGDIGTEGDETDNSYHVFNNPPGLNNSAVLDGFLITGGNANSPHNSGGGMINNGNGAGNSCSPLIRNCLFLNNRADTQGGAIYNAGYTNGNSNPILINCVFRSNTANMGGAVYNDGSIGGNSNPSLTNCSFQSNLAALGGAMGNVGYQGNSRPVLTNCVVWDNGGASTFYNGPGASVGSNYGLFESSVTGYSTGTGNLTTTASPFLSVTDSRLRTGSPAIDAGDPNSTSAINGATDLAGNPRFIGERIDIGAYELQSAPLPVSLVRFTAQAQPDHTVLLSWKTASELNNKAYLIERSKDLRSFEPIGQVSDVGGTSNGSNTYLFIDTNPYQGTSYYRLKQVDLDGSSHTYPARSVIIKGNYGVYPNPVVDQQFTLNLDEPSSAILRLYSVNGREISLIHSASSASSTVIRPGSLLTPGIYLLTVEERGTLRQYRLIVV
jgi:predicted outer membrane repeat protein